MVGETGAALIWRTVFSLNKTENGLSLPPQDFWYRTASRNKANAAEGCRRLG